ncbi:MAG: methyltransferase domain-containing protein [Trueperaceae bacterium]|nr:methyltransferase domain-containing protein [Trueperaceae bacterium]
MNDTPERPTPLADPDALRDAVSRHYADRLTTGDCCGSKAVTVDDAPADVPSFGCGDPNAAAALAPGETVLDLGSGAGFDTLRAADAVGPTGEVIGVDMTPAMLERARAAAAALGHAHVRYLEGTIEALPLPDACVDVVLSNCVVNLSSDVDAVLREAVRVLKPGGRVRISDTFRHGAAPADAADDLEGWCACEAGAHDPATLEAQARAAGLRDVHVDAPPAGVADGDVYGAVLHGTKA